MQFVVYERHEAAYGLEQVGVFGLLLGQDVELEHHVEHAAEQNGKLTDAEEHAENIVGGVQTQSLQCGGQHVGHHSEHQGDNNPEQEKGHNVEHHIGFGSGNGEDGVGEVVIEYCCQHQSEDDTDSGEYFLDESVAPAAENGPEQEGADEQVEIHTFVLVTKEQNVRTGLLQPLPW